MLALAWRNQGETGLAYAALGQALNLAEPEGYVRVLLDLGRPLVELLREGLTAHAWTEPRLVAFALRLISLAQRVGTPTTSASKGAVAAEQLFEPLSSREVQVLRLAAQGLSNLEIAKQLYLGLSTVKTHMHNIHGKLGAKSRKEAVTRARELRLFD